MSKCTPKGYSIIVEISTVVACRRGGGGKDFLCPVGGYQPCRPLPLPTIHAPGETIVSPIVPLLYYFSRQGGMAKFPCNSPPVWHNRSSLARRNRKQLLLGFALGVVATLAYFERRVVFVRPQFETAGTRKRKPSHPTSESDEIPQTALTVSRSDG